MDRLKGILKEAEGISEDELTNDFSEIEEGEEILGELSMSLKQLLSLRDKKADQIEDLIKSHFESHSLFDSVNSNCKEFQENVNFLKKELEIISDLFWFEVKSLFMDKTDVGLGIRKDFKVVSLKESDVENQLFDLMSELESMISFR
ncbi:MAG: hypothetical protein WD471_01705 [Candidatus Paceibacterota bacterium]